MYGFCYVTYIIILKYCVIYVRDSINLVLKDVRGDFWIVIHADRAGESMKSLRIYVSEFKIMKISFLLLSFNLFTLQFYINLCHALLCYKCFIYSTNSYIVSLYLIRNILFLINCFKIQSKYMSQHIFATLSSPTYIFKTSQNRG